MKGTKSIQRDEDDIPPVVQVIAPYGLSFEWIQGREHGLSNLGIPPFRW
jgi:hypothetical protein